MSDQDQEHCSGAQQDESPRPASSSSSSSDSESERPPYKRKEQHQRGSDPRIDALVNQMPMTMGFWIFLGLLFITSSVTAEISHRMATEAINICDAVTNSTNKVQCFCIKPMGGEIRSADCYIISEDLGSYDKSWDAFEYLKNVIKLTLTSSRGITLKYIPTNALALVENVLKLDIKYSAIHTIKPYAFANLTFLEELSLRDNQIKTLDEHAFSRHRDLTSINLDKNRINEINRNVFVDLPSLQKLFLTSNMITTIHDKAFQYLINLKELEIDRNALFSLNSETFFGLKHLQKLDLSSNNLEVIGDNTFLPLTNLRTLNLEGNKIQMLDEKAFNGLWKLQSLSLARNKLSNIENVKLFEGLDSLSLLSFKENQLHELRTEVMAPILSNFYRPAAFIDIDGNSFPCQCNLDWLVSLMNKTQNNRLKLAIENLQCYPENIIRDLYTKAEDTDKTSSSQVFEDEETQVTNTDYEYYDESQLNGKLFYIDMRYLLNCTNPSRPVMPRIKISQQPITKQTHEEPKESDNDIITEEIDKTTKVILPDIFKSQTTTSEPIDFTIRGDLMNEDATIKAVETPNDVTETPPCEDVKSSEPPSPPTTTRLATVSAKPLEQIHVFNEMEMAADEAKPDQLRTSISMQEEIKKTVDFKNNKGQMNLGCATVQLAAVVFVYRLSF